jgi:hypothetical protein
MSRRPIFMGEGALNEAHRRVGMIIGACARLEHAVAYLEWQLKAFSLAAATPDASLTDRQAALRTEREHWDKYDPLNNRLATATKAFDNPVVASRLKQESSLKEMRQQWDTLREKARQLGKERNAVAHTSLSWSNNTVIREIGRPWSERKVVSAIEDERLATAIGDLAAELGVLTTRLGDQLPFADQDQIHTGVDRGIDLGPLD